MECLNKSIKIMFIIFPVALEETVQKIDVVKLWGGAYDWKNCKSGC